MQGIIKVIGLGAGSIDQLQLGIYRILLNEENIYLRTADHPLVEDLKAEGLAFKSFDYCYEKHDDFASVYEEISDSLLEKANGSTLVYAVPGHPLVAEKTVQLLLEKGPKCKIEIDIVGGHSFIDSLFQSLKIDPIDGFQLLDGTDLHNSQLNIEQHLFIAQVYDQFVASNLKLTLMESLPDDYEVYIVTAAGTKDEVITKQPLYKLDWEASFNNLTSVYVPPVKDEEILLKQFSKLREIIAELRSENGCPWDRRQTHESLKKYLIEETFEVIEAIEEGDIDHLVEELGDVLLQVMLHAQIGEDDGYFNINDIIEQISRKMIRRHPHVFADEDLSNEEDVLKSWEQIKAAEKGAYEEGSLLGEVSYSKPNLQRAYEIQKEAAKLGFDWDDLAPMLAKVREEIDEFYEELNKDEGDGNLQREFGDVLFALVNVARFLKINPEEALFQTNLKFTNRFAHIERRVKESGRPFNDFTLEQLDEFWEEAKTILKDNN